MLTLYCNSFAGKDPLHQQYNQKTLMCGSYSLSTEIKQLCLFKQHILDDTLDNISHLNHLFGDLTGLYWVWKNTTDEYVGTNKPILFKNAIEYIVDKVNSSSKIIMTSTENSLPVSLYMNCNKLANLGFKCKFNTFEIFDQLIEFEQNKK